MITFFTVPKPFEGDIARIQRAAILSWRELHPDCELFLCGNAAGIEAVAKAYDAHVVRDIETNEYGTPLLNSVFEAVSQRAAHRCLAYLNADIMLVDDLRPLVRSIRRSLFLLVSRRVNLPASVRVDAERDGWEAMARRTAREDGTLGPPKQCDLFVFPKHEVFTDIPAFAVGRPGWDNWFIYNAYRRRIPLVDASRHLTLIHQYHDYAHVPEGREGVWEGPEGDRNRELAGGWNNLFFTIADATYRPVKGGIRAFRDTEHVDRRVERMRRLRPRLFRRLLAWKVRKLLCFLVPRL